MPDIGNRKPRRHLARSCHSCNVASVAKGLRIGYEGKWPDASDPMATLAMFLKDGEDVQIEASNSGLRRGSRRGECKETSCHDSNQCKEPAGENPLAIGFGRPGELVGNAQFPPPCGLSRGVHGGANIGTM